MAAVAIAYILAVLFNYTAHYYWTFQTDASHVSAGPKFLLVTAAVFAINAGATELAPSLFGVDYVTVQFAFAALLGCATIVAHSKWVFKAISR